MLRLLVIASIVLVAALVAKQLLVEPDSSPGASPSRAAPAEGSRSDALAEASSSAAADGRTAASPTALADPPSRTVAVSIRGRAIDLGGAPVGGVTLEVWSRSAGAARQSGPADWTGTTDDLGQFELRDLPAGRARLQASGAEHAPAALDFDWPGVRDLVLPDVTLFPGFVLRGVVLGLGGAPIAGADLTLVRSVRGLGGEASGGLPDLAVAVSGADGRFATLSIAAGPWELRVDANGYAPQSFQGASSRLDSERGLELRLHGTASIAGTVVDHLGEGVPDVEVLARFVRGQPGVEALPRGTPDFGIARTGPGGAFQIPDLASGTARTHYDLVARRPTGRRTRISADVRAHAGQSGVVLACPPPSFLTVGVSGAGGRALAPDEIRVELRARTGARSRVSATRGAGLRVTEAGHVSIGPLPVVVRSECRLTVVHQGYETLEVRGPDLSPGDSAAMEPLTLTPNASAVVRVIDAGSGEPLQGATVVAQPWYTDPRERYEAGAEPVTARSDSAGTARLSLVSRLPYGVTATCAGYSVPEPVIVAPSDLRAAAAAGAGAEVELALTRGARLLVDVRGGSGEALSGVRVELTQAADDARATALRGAVRLRDGGDTDAQGRLELEHLHAGLHFVRVAGERGWTRVVLGEGEERVVVLSVATRAALVGRVSLDGRPLVSAWVAALEAPVEGSYNYSELEKLGALRRTDVAGRFELPERPCTEHRLVVFSEQLALPHRTTHLHVPGGGEVAIEIAANRVAGRVVDGEGRAVANALVALARADQLGQVEFRLRHGTTRLVGRPRGDVPIPLAVGPDGEFSLSSCPSLEPLFLAVSAPGRSTVAVELPSPGPGPIVDAGDVVLPLGGALSVELDAQLPPYGLTTCEVVPGEHTAGIRRVVELAEDEPFLVEGLVEGLCPGEWWVEVRWRPARGAEAIVVTSERVEMGEDEDSDVVLRW